VILEPAHKAAPDNAEVLLLTAAARTETGDIDEALAAYAEAEKKGPTALLYWGRGLLYRKLREDDPALADLRRALAMDLAAGQAATARRAVGAILAQRRRWSEAEAELRRAVELEPGNPGGRTLLAQVLLESGKPAEAAREAEQALASQPGDAEARLALAWARADQKRYEDAAAEIARAVQIEGETGRVWLARGRLAAAQGNPALAVEHLEPRGAGGHDRRLRLLPDGDGIPGGRAHLRGRAQPGEGHHRRSDGRGELDGAGTHLPGREPRARRHRVPGERGRRGARRRRGRLPARGGPGAGGPAGGVRKGGAPGQGPRHPGAEALLQSLTRP
jgi:Flp pilus assembly protein TadD